jgi:hypothetical protein
VNLVLQRRFFEPTCTIGSLVIDGVYECWILEDVEREVKVYGETAIPLGRYRIIIDHSNRFQRLLPRLLDVPGFEGIRIHPGNRAVHTDGCLLPGQDKYADSVGHSVIAFGNLYRKLRRATDDIYIEVRH